MNGGSAVEGRCDAQFADLVVQNADREIQHPGGCGDVAAVGFQCLDDQGAFKRFDPAGEIAERIGTGMAGRRLQCGGQSVGVDGVVGGGGAC